MKLAVIGMGLSGSGKTTILKPLAEKYGLVYISRDEIRKEFFGNPIVQIDKKRVWKEADERTAQALQNGQSVLLDSRFLEPWKRRNTIAFVQRNGATRVVGVLINEELETIKVRNKSRSIAVPEHSIDNLHQMLLSDPPSISEGFDALYTLNELREFEEQELKSLITVLPTPRGSSERW